MKITYKLKNIYWNILRKMEQIILRKKYKDFDIPIRNGQHWYFKEFINLEQNLYEIQKYEFWQTWQFENYAHIGLQYSYSYGTFKNIPQNEIDEFQNFTHSHEYYSILEEIYDFPESFFIKEKYQKDYSYQELQYIQKLQQKCLNDGLKDIGYFTKSNNTAYHIMLVYNLSELKKRNITKLKGVNIKKYLNKIDDDAYITFDEKGKIIVYKNLL